MAESPRTRAEKVTMANSSYDDLCCTAIETLEMMEERYGVYVKDYLGDSANLYIPILLTYLALCTKGHDISTPLAARVR
jgi:hypothetical protein